MPFGGSDAGSLSGEEKALINVQTQNIQLATSILQEQTRKQELLEPILLKEAGIETILDEQGNVVGFEKIGDPLESLREEVEKGGLERTLAALRGELPDNPALLRDLDVAERTLNERLRKQLGPGFETGTPGIEAIGGFLERREGILETARRGDLSTAAGLAGQFGATNEQNENAFIQNVAGLSGLQSQTAGQLLGSSNAGGPALSAFGQARTAAAQEDAATTAAITSALAIAAGIAIASSEELKEGIEDVSEEAVIEKMMSLPIKKWQYKKDTPHFDGKRHIGPMAEDFQEAFGVGDGKTLHMSDMLGVLMAANKGVVNRLGALENG